jgi:hypothetical protein
MVNTRYWTWSIRMLLLTPLGVVAGCGGGPTITLRQEFAPPTQRTIELAAQEAWLRLGESGVALAAAFPLPGSINGPRAYALYVRTGQSTTGSGTRGFLIQEIGRLAGRTDIVRGTVTVEPVALRSGLHDVDVVLICDDGSEVRGRLRARVDSARVAEFEREFAADVADLAPRRREIAGSPGKERP